MSETDAEELDAFKAYVIERSRCPSETSSARQRALIACLVIPASIQKWMLEVGAVDPLLDSLEKTILAAEKYAREVTGTPQEQRAQATGEGGMKKRRLIHLRFRKNDPAHNLLAATQHWIKANGGDAVVIGGIGLLREGRPGCYRVCVGFVGTEPKRPERDTANQPVQAVENA